MNKREDGIRWRSWGYGGKITTEPWFEEVKIKVLKKTKSVSQVLGKKAIWVELYLKPEGNEDDSTPWK